MCATGEGGFGNVGLGMWGVGRVDGIRRFAVERERWFG